MSKFAFTPKYHIVDRHTGQVVGKANSLRAARRSVDKRDDQYGAARYYHKRVDELDRAQEIAANHPANILNRGNNGEEV